MRRAAHPSRPTALPAHRHDSLALAGSSNSTVAHTCGSSKMPRGAHTDLPASVARVESRNGEPQ